MMKKSGKQNPDHIKEWAELIRTGNRRALARAVTLIESSRYEDLKEARKLLEHLLPSTGNAVRIGISGVPGAGKSTFIESMGTELLQKSHKVAVLAIDPSSPKTGGSILGDKTRMSEFAKLKNVFVRPSPAGRTPGGVARKTRESMLLCEAAGFDIVLIETVGVGQAEWAVAEMVDFLVLFTLPNAGDTIQGMKRGVLEMADAIFVNKADGGSEEAARIAKEDIINALSWSGQKEEDVLIRTCSGKDRPMVRECWQQISEIIGKRKKTSRFYEKRENQLRSWVQSIAVDTIIHAVRDSNRYNEELEKLIHDIKAGHTTPLGAGMTFRKLILRRLSDESEFPDIPV